MVKIRWYKDKLKADFCSERVKILEKLARGYCTEKNKHKTVDPDLMQAMADELLRKG